MLDGMEHNICFQHRHRSIGHLERRVVLAVAVEGIMLAKTDCDDIWNLKNGSFSENTFKFSVSLIVKPFVVPRSQ
jgi:hypothetical protein